MNNLPHQFSHIGPYNTRPFVVLVVQPHPGEETQRTPHLIWAPNAGRAAELAEANARNRRLWGEETYLEVFASPAMEHNVHQRPFVPLEEVE